jgi:hypothetical protein
MEFFLIQIICSVCYIMLVPYNPLDKNSYNVHNYPTFSRNKAAFKEYSDNIISNR